MSTNHIKTRLSFYSIANKIKLEMSIIMSYNVVLFMLLYHNQERGMKNAVEISEFLYKEKMLWLLKTHTVMINKMQEEVKHKLTYIHHTQISAKLNPFIGLLILTIGLFLAMGFL